MEDRRVHHDELGDFVLDVYYEGATYRVAITHVPSNEVKEKHVQASYAPEWGIDVSDLDYIMEAAESMCQEFER